MWNFRVAVFMDEDDQGPLYRPAFVFGYYSGPSDRLSTLYEKHRERYYDEIIKDPARRKTDDPNRLRRLFYAETLHGQFALIAFFMAPGDAADNDRTFLREHLQTDGLDSVLFALKRPPWRRKGGDSRFWNAVGEVQQFLDRVYAGALLPIRMDRRMAADLTKNPDVENLYLFLPNADTLESVYQLYGNQYAFFTALESTHLSKLLGESEMVAAEGWKWIEVAPDFAHGHAFGLRQLRGETIALTAEEEATRDAFQAEFDRLSEEYQDADELPDEVDERLSELETALEGFETRPVVFDTAEIARAGAFVSIGADGQLRVERGYIRPEDELAAEPEDGVSADDEDERPIAASSVGAEAIVTTEAVAEPEEDEGLSPISDRLMTELTSHRTLTLRHALGERPDIAFLAALHVLTLKTFYQYGSDSCLELDLKSVSFGTQAPGLNDSASAEAIRTRHESWAKALPKESADLWEALQEWDGDSQAGLFAHIVSLSVNAVYEPWNRRPRAVAHADRLAQAVDLNMAAAGWKPTVDNFLGRVTKARILQAVAQAKDQRAADRIEHLKKGDMAMEAETLLADTGWLPEPLRTQKKSGSITPSEPTKDGGMATDPVGAETATDG